MSFQHTILYNNHSSFVIGTGAEVDALGARLTIDEGNEDYIQDFSSATGYFEIELPQTLVYDFSFSYPSSTELYKEKSLKIPVATSKNYDDPTT